MKTLFCIGCQLYKNIELFEKLPPGNLYKFRDRSWDCMECQSNGKDKTSKYWRDQYKKHGTVCHGCSFPRELVADDLCKRCLADTGYKVCSGCKQKKLQHLEFYSHRSECTACSGPSNKYVKCQRCEQWINPLKHKTCRKSGPWKKCRRCKQTQDEVEFDGRRICKSCCEKSKEGWISYKESPEFKEKERRSKLTHKERVRDTQLRKTYGITIDDFYKMVEIQGGHCAICGGPPNKNKTLCLDHDHKTGKPRKLLCHNCNWGIGALKDDPALLRLAAEYLERHSLI